MPGIWLPITDYSTKYKISVSTLRRRIKADDIKYRFLEGKYLLLDEPVTTSNPLHRPSLSDSLVNESASTASGHNPTHGFANNANDGSAQMSAQTQPGSPFYANGSQPIAFETAATALNNLPPPSEVNLDGPILSAANRLLTELKKAYSQILQEKEEHILQLREEVTDLKTLVRVLEGENDKLNSRLGTPHRALDI